MTMTTTMRMKKRAGVTARATRKCFFFRFSFRFSFFCEPPFPRRLLLLLFSIFRKWILQQVRQLI